MVDLAVAVPQEAGDMTTQLTQTNLDAIEAAVTQCESVSDGELVTVIAEHSDDDGTQDDMLIAALTALCLPALIVALFGGGVALIFSLQVLVFFGVYALLQHMPALRMRLLPESVKQQRVRKHAIEQFFLQGLHNTDGRMGVLIFASLAEQRVEILADVGFDGKVNPVAWQRAINAMVARVKRGELHTGLIEAIVACGDTMAKAAPATGVAENALPNRLIVVK